MNDATFHAKLSSILTDNKFDRWVSGKRTGKVDTKRLYKIKQAGTIFKKKEARKGKDYSVILVIDTSGSMNGEKINVAVQSAEKLHKHLTKLGVRHKIIGFDTFIHLVKDWDDKPVSTQHFWETLWSPYEHYLITQEYELVHETDVRYLELYTTGNYEKVENMRGCNVDGFAINQARLDLVRQKGEKIMIVFSDGQPADDDVRNAWVFGSKEGRPDRKRYRDFSLIHEVREAIRGKITFLSVGILTESVWNYYPHQNTVVINNLNELYGSVTGKLSKLIRRG